VCAEVLHSIWSTGACPFYASGLEPPCARADVFSHPLINFKLVFMAHILEKKKCWRVIRGEAGVCCAGGVFGVGFVGQAKRALCSIKYDVDLLHGFI
jgi:hypothetical protein